MNLRCCNRIRHPKVSFRASVGDIIGIFFLGGFFGGILFLVGWVVFYALWSSIDTGEYGSRAWYGIRHGVGYLVLLIAIIKIAPTFMKILSFFVNYRLKISSNCQICNDEQVHVDLPTKADPF